MHYEKAELILQWLMAGDRDFYLVKKDGRSVITDKPTEDQLVLGILSSRRHRKEEDLKTRKEFLC